MKKTILNLLQDSKNDILYEIDLATKEIIWYQNLSIELGYSDNFKLNNFIELENIIHKEDKEIFQSKLTIKENEKQEIVYRIKNFNDEYISYSDKFIYYKFENEEKILGSYSKVNHENEKNYFKLFQASKIPVLLTVPNSGEIIDANKYALDFYAYTLEEIKQETIYSLSTSSKKEIFEKIEKANKNNLNYYQLKHKVKTNKEVNVEIYSEKIEFNNQTLMYTLVFDISRRKKIEKNLKLANTIYQNTKEGIFITNTNGYILSVNKAFENITGYKENEVLHKKVNILKSNKHDKTFYKSLWLSLIEKGYWEGEIINKDKSGKLYPQWLTINTVYDEDNKASKFVAVFTDFTKLKQQEELIREKDKIMFHQSKMAAMGEMLRNIAHQWRQPLSVISSSASGLKLKKEFGILDDKDFSDFSEGIIKSATYLSDTIEDFSNYFKNDKKEEFFFVKNTVEKSIHLIEATLRENSIILELDFNDNVRLYGIENELIQVLLNIINNSKDAFSSNDDLQKIINITTSVKNKQLIISIKDNAGGIKKDIIDKIFEPYFTTKHQFQGTGIGLYMSQQLIRERLNGNISVSNTNIKDIKGAKFLITIPLNEIKE